MLLTVLVLESSTFKCLIRALRPRWRPWNLELIGDGRMVDNALANRAQVCEVKVYIARALCTELDKPKAEGMIETGSIVIV